MVPIADLAPLYLAASIDLQEAIDWLAATNAQRAATDRLMLDVLLLKATASALRDVPELHGLRGVDGTIRRGPVHLGVTVTRHTGVPASVVLPNADTCRLDLLMRAFRDAVAAVRRGPVAGADTPPTFTVTSLGARGVQAVFPSIVPPQIAGIGFGAVTEQPAAIRGAIVCSPVVTATLAADQRATDSHRGGRFLTLLGDLLQRPEAL